MDTAVVLGNLAGRVVADITWTYTGITVLAKSYKIVKHIAVIHSLDKSIPDAVSDNCFKCLEYID